MNGILIEFNSNFLFHSYNVIFFSNSVTDYEGLIKTIQMSSKTNPKKSFGFETLVGDFRVRFGLKKKKIRVRVGLRFFFFRVRVENRVDLDLIILVLK